MISNIFYSLCLFAILISSLLKLPFKCLAYIFVCPYFFLSWKSSAYIWINPFFFFLGWINPLLCIYLANIFPPVCSLFFKIFLEYLLKRHFISKVFWCNLIYPFFFFFFFFLNGTCFCILRNLWLIQGYKDFLLGFLLEIVLF